MGEPARLGGACRASLPTCTRLPSPSRALLPGVIFLHASDDLVLGVFDRTAIFFFIAAIANSQCNNIAIMGEPAPAARGRLGRARLWQGPARGTEMHRACGEGAQRSN